MRYSKGLVIYQGRPEYGASLALTLAAVAAALLGSALYLFSTGESEGGRALLLELFLIGLILFVAAPRGYHVYEDHIRIMLGGPFSVKVGFEKIKSIEISGRLRLNSGVNFTTTFTGKLVVISVKKGLSISITPKDSEAFVENANRILREWTKTNSKS